MSNEIIDSIRSGQLDVMKWLDTQDEDTIRERLFSRIDEEFDTSEGSYLFDAIEPSTIEFSIVYFMLRNIILLAFPQHSFGEWLKLAASSRGVDMNEATYATGEVCIYGTEGTLIPSGTRFSNTVPDGSRELPKYYTTQENALITSRGYVYVLVKSDDAGTIGNVQSNEINVNIDDINGITSIYNNEPISNGFDEETDEALLERLLERVRNPPSSGNKSDYKRWAKEIPGVLDADVVPLWSGPGTVKVVIMGVNNEPIPELIKTVKEHIDPTDGLGDGKAPIGAIIEVATIENLVVDVIIKGLEIKEGYAFESIKSNIKDALMDYIVSIEVGGTIRIHSIENRITSVTGVKDFDEVYINDGTKNIKIDTGLKASLGDVAYES